MSFLRLTQSSGRVFCRAINVNKNSKRNLKLGVKAPQVYREQPTVQSKWLDRYVEAFIASVVIYVGYNMYHHPQHFIGEFPKIRPSLWTDEELGIPPDDEDIYPPGYIPLKDRRV